MKEDHIGGTCSTHGLDGKYTQNFSWERLKRRCQCQDLAVDGRTRKWVMKEQDTFREREKKVGGVVVRETTVWRGV
jgi:hypothetical protein